MSDTARSVGEKLVWRYEVNPESITAFEDAYGPGGDWDEFFKGARGYEGTEFYRAVTKPNVYITVDYWSRPGQRDDYVASRRPEFDAIDERCERFTEDERRLA